MRTVALQINCMKCVAYYRLFHKFITILQLRKSSKFAKWTILPAHATGYFLITTSCTTLPTYLYKYWY